MKPLSLDMAFPELRNDITQWKDQINESGQLPAELMSEEEGLDVRRWYVLYLANNGLVDEAIQELSTINRDLYAGTLGGAWLYLAEMALQIERNEFNYALEAGEQSLRVLASMETDRTHIDYLALVAGVVYCLAVLHHKVGENVRAEKELVKAQKLLEKLAKKDKMRFGASIVNAIEASTTIFNSRLKQMNILAHYQITTDLYLDKAHKGVTQAIYDLVESLQNEGDLHLKIGNYRDAVKYYTKALRYQKKVTPKMGERELRISINMGRALLHITARQSTGEQLLRSLIPLAERLDAINEKNEIQAILDHKGKAFDFMSFIKKIF
jgi:tetratricopeptide (TPR) repeat protein